MIKTIALSWSRFHNKTLVFCFILFFKEIKLDVATHAFYLSRILRRFIFSVNPVRAIYQDCVCLSREGSKFDQNTLYDILNFYGFFFKEGEGRRY